MDNDFYQNLPIRFKKIVTAMPHFDGNKWLNSLPIIIDEIEKKWSLKAQKHYQNLSYNYVAPCICSDGIEAVLKIGLPEKGGSEIFDEARVLKLFDGNGTVKLFKFDEELEILLLEKVTPGQSLKKVFVNDKDRAIEVAIDLLKKILKQTPKSHEYPTLDDWFADFDVKRKKFSLAQFDKASKILWKLNSDSSNKRLLHGDFHHDNILSSEREEFLAIDPNGLVGNIGYDIAVFLNNHADWLKDEPNLHKKLSSALKQFSDSFEISENELRKWAYAQQVISAWWDFEDNGKDWQKHLEFAEIWE